MGNEFEVGGWGLAVYCVYGRGRRSRLTEANPAGVRPRHRRAPGFTRLCCMPNGHTTQITVRAAQPLPSWRPACRCSSPSPRPDLSWPLPVPPGGHAWEALQAAANDNVRHFDAAAAKMGWKKWALTKAHSGGAGWRGMGWVSTRADDLCNGGARGSMSATQCGTVPVGFKLALTAMWCWCLCVVMRAAAAAQPHHYTARKARVLWARSAVPRLPAAT